ncbi:MAG: hypothetical protein JOZ95_10765 [Solirubrobacterales bacterium]|nr:hypothetical protein [Solirubrobacterales bacterium]
MLDHDLHIDLQLWAHSQIPASTDCCSLPESRDVEVARPGRLMVDAVEMRTFGEPQVDLLPGYRPSF